MHTVRFSAPDRTWQVIFGYLEGEPRVIDELESFEEALAICARANGASSISETLINELTMMRTLIQQLLASLHDSTEELRKLLANRQRKET